MGKKSHLEFVMDIIDKYADAELGIRIEYATKTADEIEKELDEEIDILRRDAKERFEHTRLVDLNTLSIYDLTQEEIEGMDIHQDPEWA